MTDLNVGKFGKNGVDLSKFNGGLKKENLKTEEQKSIFDAIDADKNGVIDEKEMQDFKAKLDKSEDSHVSRREARKFLKENNLKDLSKNDVLKFLNEYAVNTENVKSAKVVEEGGKKTVHVEYEDGTSEVINPDRSSRISQTDQNGTTTTRFLDENKKLQKDTVSTQDGLTTETSYAEDGQTPTKQVISDNTKGSVSTVDYTEGKPSKKEVKQGATTSNYTFDEQGNEVLNSKVENQGIPAKEKRTDYTYNKDGTVSENIKENGKTTERLLKGDQIISEKINDNGKIYDRTYYEKGYEEKTTDDNGNPTVNVYSLDNKKLAQQKTINGQTVSVLYDGEGNTKTIVQNGESPSSIAKKFGCSVEDLVALNKDVLGGKKYFNVGAEIRVPGEIAADSPSLKNRKTAEEAKAEYERDAAIRAQKRAEAAAREAQYKSLGLINHKGEGKKITGTWKGGRKENFTIIGESGNGRHLAKGKNGKLVTIAHDGVILKDDYVTATNLYASGKKIKGKIKVKNNDGKISLVTKDYVEIKDANLPHGRKAVVDSKGKVWVMSHDGVILDNNYVAKSNYADSIKGDKATAQKATVDMLTNQLDSAQAAFDAQMKEDGWAADVADGISNIWGVFQEDGNQAWRVRKDLKAYRQNINELKAAAAKGDKQFQAKFKEIFGVNYSQEAIANYMMKPTDANYKKAFGTKNNIGQRVAKYNSSQQTGAAVVKGATTVAAGIAIGVATGGTGLVALGAAATGTAGASFAINASDRISSDVGLKEGELGQIAENAVWDGASVLAGGAVGKVASATIKGTKTAAAVTRAAVNTVGDVTMGAAQEYAQTGQITVEGTAMNAALGTVGLAAESGVLKSAGNKIKNMLHKNPKSQNVNVDVPAQSSTPVLDKASSQGNSHPANVKVGKEKAAQISNEVSEVASNPNATGEELAQVRKEVGAISNRNVRRSGTRQIDEAAENLSAGEKANFDAANRANSQADVDHIFERHNELNPTDVRVMNEYIKNTDDISVLQDLQKKLDIKEHTYGGVTSNYKALRKSIEDRIAGLQPKTVLSNAQQRESVVSMLGEKAKTGKGLSPDEFNQVNAYISSIGDANQLKEIKGLLGGKKMTSAQKKQLKEVLENKTNELKMQAQPQVQPQGTTEATPVTEHYVDPHHIVLDGTPKASAPDGKTFEGFESVQRKLASEQPEAPAGSTPSVKPEAEVDPHHIVLDDAPKASAPDGKTFEGFESVQRKLASEQPAASAGSTPSVKPEVEVDPHHIVLDDAPKASAPNGNTADFVAAHKQLQQKPHDDLVAMLNEKAKTGKGLNQAEVNQVNDYISTITDKAQLKEVRGLLAGKKMTAAQKNQLKEALNAKEKTLNSVATPEAETSTVKSQESVETPKVTKESVDANVKSIADAEIPSAQRKLWADCKQRISDITNELSTSFKGNKAALVAKCKTLFADLKTISANASASVKQKINNLMKQLRTMMTENNLVKDSAQTPSVKARAYQDYTKAEVGTYLPNGEDVLLTGTERLRLANTTLDLNSPQVKSVLGKMKKGDVITVGREGDIRINDASNTVSRKHLTIEKTDNGFIVKDTSTNGTSIAAKRSVKNSAPAAAPAAKPTKYQDYTKAEVGTYLPNGEGVLLNGTERLKLANSTLDLNSPQVRTVLDRMKKGDVITVGREGDIRINDASNTVSRKHLTIEKTDNGFIVKDTSSNGTSIAARRATENKSVRNAAVASDGLPVINENELVRNVGNDGKPINKKYIKTSREARQYLNESIASGDYTRSLDSYIETMNDMHVISAQGKSGNDFWYKEAGQGGIPVNPGVIRGRGEMLSPRYNQAMTVEDIAKRYGDPYRVPTEMGESIKVRLKGIPDEYLPECKFDYNSGSRRVGYFHVYPDGSSLETYYYKEMYRTSKEALELINNGAPKNQILGKLAEHYQYAANARPYGQINNSLFMNELNTLLSKAGLKTIPHGELDIAAQRLQPNTFKKYFVDQYNKTALDSPNVKPSGSQNSNLYVEVEPEVKVADEAIVLGVEPANSNKVSSLDMDGTPALTGKFKNLSRQIDKATTLRELEQIEDSLMVMNDSPEKKALLNKVNQKRAEINSNIEVLPYVEADDVVDYQQQQRIQDDLNNQFAADYILQEQMNDDLFNANNGLDGMEDDMGGLF